MQLLRTIRLLGTFYRSFLAVSIVVDLGSAVLFHIFFSVEPIRELVAIFWIKVVTLGLSIYFVNEQKKKEYYYYQNLGISKRFLWIILCSVDWLILIITLFITSLFQ